MTKKRKKPNPKLLPCMIVVGMSHLAMIFAVAVYAAVRSEFGVRRRT